MPSVAEVNEILSFIRDQEDRLKHNHKIVCILEGDLLKFVEEHFRNEFSEGDSVKQVMPRIAPINYLIQITDKLSKIYQQPVSRTIIDGTEQDQELLNWYQRSFEMDAVMNSGNEYFNTFKQNLNQAFISRRRPKLRAMPNDRWLVYSNDPVEPTRPTHIIIPFGHVEKTDNRFSTKIRKVSQFIVWTENEAYMLDSEGKTSPFLSSGGFDNPLGLDLFMYVNKSRAFLNPPIDSDTFRMTVLLSVLLSDLNYAAKFQTFSVMYGIDLNDENIKWKPNGFMFFKSEPESDKTPQLGQLTPQAAINQMIELIATELSMWLKSKNIRPGSIGQISGDNIASGISKLVDEADTSDDRKKQVEHYRAAEIQWWDGIMHNAHEIWVNQDLIDQSMRFSPNAKVNVEFPPQIPLVNRGDLVRDLADEVAAGFISRDSAILKLNPSWGNEELTNEKQKINEQFEVSIDGGQVAEN